MQIECLPVDDVVVGARERPLNTASVEALADSIAEIGLQQPITVVRTRHLDEKGVNTDGYKLVSGYHRLEAVRSLGLAEIEATVSEMSDLDRQLWEIDENLCRNELTELERADHLHRRKQIYEARHPETRHGGAPGKSGGGKQPKDAKLATFAEDTASKTGSSDRSIRRSISRSGRICSEAKDLIAPFRNICDSGVELDALAALKYDDQVAVAQMVSDGEAASIRAAKKQRKQKTRTTTEYESADEAKEKWKNSVRRLWNKASHEWRSEMLHELQEQELPVSDWRAAQ